MILPLMPKATAVWLVTNTSLTFQQIADFCGIHVLEVQGIADEEIDKEILGVNPIHSKQLTKEEIQRCEEDPNGKLQLSEVIANVIKAERKKQKGHYTPMARRQNKPNAVAWLLRNCPEVSDSQISKLLGTTKKTIEAIRSKTHWNHSNIKIKDPVLLGLCTQTELNNIYEIAKLKAEREVAKRKE